MEEIHSMLQRIKTLSTQSANGTYTHSDRDLIEKEVKQLIKEVDRIANDTEFNGMKLLDGTFSGASVISSTSISSPLVTNSNNKVMTLNEAVNYIDKDSIGIFIENISEYVTAKTTNGANTASAYEADFVSQLENEIVPNAIQQLLRTYSSLGYLNGSSVGIALELYSDSSSSVLASVGIGLSGTLSSVGKGYVLSINSCTTGSIRKYN